jgi:hypothetical protein
MANWKINEPTGHGFNKYVKLPDGNYHPDDRE